jgi:hypothetical protein
MSHSTTKNDTHGGSHSAAPKADAKAAAPRDAAADAQKMLCLLAADWLNNDRTHSAEIASLLASLVTAAGPPTVVDVPLATLNGSQLSCTMGNWTGDPDTYAYAWQSDGVLMDGAASATYSVTPEDSGHSLACVVTATNANGATTAPPSNAVAVP